MTAVSYRPIILNVNACDIFNWERFLLIPVHSGVHWTIILVDLQQRTIRILDSMMNSEGEARAVMQMEALETFLGQFLVHNGVYAQAR
jgi:Ulp1 family protease